MSAPARARDLPRLAMAPRVKFCGLVRPEDAAEAARLGACYVGSVFAGGPRQVDAGRARLAADAARAACPGAPPRTVGVMGTQPVAEIAALAGAAALDIVQLHADPTADDVAALRRLWAGHVWAVLRVAGTEIPPHAAALASAADGLVLDARVDGAPLGGTGVALDWDALADALAPLRGRTPLVLAGGLRPENVDAAVRALAPDVVDVSSGVEQAPGVKDHARMAAFAAAAAGRRTS